jgi:ATP-dependent HslUV protease subunit HslV
MQPNVHATTIIAVRRDGAVAMAGDGQVTVSDTIMKGTARKVQRMRNGTVLAGYAGGAADALTLFERFEGKLDQFQGNLSRAAHELVKDWRADRALRQLEALMVVADKQEMLVISGNGDLIRPDSDVVGIGSGGGFALAAAKALLAHSSLTAAEIATEAIRIAASICVFTNDQITVEVLE